VWAKQLLTGLRTLHSLGVIHRDIKPDNLLCTEDGVLKIADFGWCADATSAPTTLAGTFQYMAPEVLKNHPQTEKADVWSSGVVLFELLTGRQMLTTYLGPGATGLTNQDPHEATAVKQDKLIEEISATCPPAYDARPGDLSLLCWDFLRGLLIPDPKRRITVAAALLHPWFDDLQTSSAAVSEDADLASLSNEMPSAGCLDSTIVEDQAPLATSPVINGVRSPPARFPGYDKPAALPAHLGQVPTPTRARTSAKDIGSTTPFAPSKEQKKQPLTPVPTFPCESRTSPPSSRGRRSPMMSRASMQCKSPERLLAATTPPGPALRRRMSQNSTPQPHQKTPTVTFQAPGEPVTPKQAAKAGNHSFGQSPEIALDEPDKKQDPLLQKVTDQKKRLADILGELLNLQEHSSSLAHRARESTSKRAASVPPNPSDCKTQLDAAGHGNSLSVSTKNLFADATEGQTGQTGVATPRASIKADMPVISKDILSATVPSLPKFAQNDESSTLNVKIRPCRMSTGGLPSERGNENIPPSNPPLLTKVSTPRGFKPMEQKTVVRHVTMPRYTGHPMPTRIHPPWHVELPPSAVIVAAPTPPAVHLCRPPLVMIAR